MHTDTHGQKQRGYLPVPGTSVELPYTDIRGSHDGPTLFVTGGIHGGEYPGIEAAIRFSRAVRPQALRGRIIVIHMTNPPAFFGKRQYESPLDRKNLNRVFPGYADGSPSERIAAAVMQMLAACDFWVDLHGGDIHESLIPFTLFSDYGSDALVRRTEAMARSYGISHILRSSSIASGSYAQAAHRGIPAILVEAGQVGQLDETAVGPSTPPAWTGF